MKSRKMSTEKNIKSYPFFAIKFKKKALRIDYGDDGKMHALVHSNLNSSAMDYPN